MIRMFLIYVGTFAINLAQLGFAMHSRHEAVLIMSLCITGASIIGLWCYLVRRMEIITIRRVADIIDPPGRQRNDEADPLPSAGLPPTRP